MSRSDELDLSQHPHPPPLTSGAGRSRAVLPRFARCTLTHSQGFLFGHWLHIFHPTCVLRRPQQKKVTGGKQSLRGSGETGRMHPAVLMDAAVWVGGSGWAKRGPEKVAPFLGDWVAIGCSMIFVSKGQKMRTGTLVLETSLS